MRQHVSRGLAPAADSVRLARRSAIAVPVSLLPAATPISRSQDLSGVPVRNEPSLRIQAKLMVGQTDDPAEHEADRIADQVMRMPEPQARPERRFSLSDGDVAPSPPIQTKSLGTRDSAGFEAPPIVHGVLRSPGQPLDAATRAFFEPRFRHDFSGVRVHTGEVAAQSAISIGASAFTAGRHIVFGAHEFPPRTESSRALIAHELAHTLQQEPAGRVLRQHDSKEPTVTVKKGEDLFDIASAHGTTIKILMDLNGLTSPFVKAGQKLKLPPNRGPKSSDAGHKTKVTDDTYGKLKRPHYGDYTITKADLETAIAYKDPVSGSSYSCKAKDTFYGIWVQYELERAYVAAHAKGKDKAGHPHAFAPIILIPRGALLFISVENWNKLDIAGKVRMFDGHPSWDLEQHLKDKFYPKLNAEYERRLKLHRPDKTGDSFDWRR